MEKAALVTGASGGIGRAICLRLAEDGFDIAIHYNSNEAAAQALQREIEGFGRRAVTIAADLSTPSGCTALVEECLASLGLYALINNAGIASDGLLMRMTDVQYNDVVRTNLDSCFYCTRAALPSLLKARKGRIVNIASVVGLSGNAGQANYAAAKAGMIGLTKSCAREIASRGITVNAVAPGFIQTAMTDKLGEDIKARMKQAIPMGRFGSAAEVADMVGFLCSERAAYVTGQVLVVDGGMTMQG
jgi:3-oxoacyl-[acyl-carrier protein] reductase